MKHRTADLEGVLLDAAVAKAQGFKFAIENFMTNPPKPGACWLRDPAGKPLYTHGKYAPSTEWGQGGPIIEREGIDLDCEYHGDPASWTSGAYWASSRPLMMSGPTPLIAAMRAYVASKLGGEVELP